MAGVEILSRFEVSLGEEVFQRLRTPGGVCETENWGQLLDGLSTHSCCVQLQKVDDYLIKLFITLYGPNAEDQASTTTGPPVTGNGTTTGTETEESSMQTDARHQQHTHQQTDKQQQQHTEQQTDKQQQQHTEQQTDAQQQQQTETQPTATQHSEQQTETQLTATQHSQQQTETQQQQQQQQHSQQQTEAQQVDHEHVQTEGVPSAHQVSQTDKVQLKNSNMQAGVDTAHGSVQTEKKMHQTQGSQTEFEVVLVQPKQDQQTQAGPSCHIENQQQTDLSMFAYTDGGSQTLILQTSQGHTQTEIESYDQMVQVEVDVAECECQATVDMAETTCQTKKDEQETSCQTQKDEQETSCQTEKEEAQVESQTDISMALQAAKHVQAVVETNSQPMQASVTMSGGEAQTDISMALQVDQDMQAVADSADGDMQTDIKEMASGSAQTELDITQSASQTDIAAIGDNSSQTEKATIEDNSCQTEVPEEAVAAQQQSESVPSSQQTVASDTDPAPLDLPDPEAGAAGSPVKRANLEYREESAQTDPVTIIIGDASFLVKKLKSSSLSPTKVSSSGNEIEIELRADTDGGEYELPEHPAYVPHFDEKENATVGGRQIMQQPMRGRGVRTRGGGGAQLRSPGATLRGRGARNQMSRPVQVQQMVTYQQVVANQGVIGGGTSTGVSPGTARGKFSCPLCVETFHESPALYDHLAQLHKEAFGMIKKPRGREGKTILMKKEVLLSPSPEPEPPVLTPVEPLLVQPGVVQEEVQTVDAAPQQEITGLFEDPGEPPVRARTTPSTPRRRRMEGPSGSLPEEETTADNSTTEDFGFSCPVCPEKFCRSSQLLAHLQFSHNAKVAEMKSGQAVVKVEASSGAAPAGAAVETDEDVQESQATKRKRDSVEETGKRQKLAEPEEDLEDEVADEVEVTQEEAPRKRGRPRRSEPTTPKQDEPPRPRGRPVRTPRH